MDHPRRPRMTCGQNWPLGAEESEVPTPTYRFVTAASALVARLVGGGPMHAFGVARGRCAGPRVQRMDNRSGAAVMMWPWTRRRSGQPSTATASTWPAACSTARRCTSSSPTSIASSLSWPRPTEDIDATWATADRRGDQFQVVLHTHNVQNYSPSVVAGTPRSRASSMLPRRSLDRTSSCTTPSCSRSHEVPDRRSRCTRTGATSRRRATR